MGAANNIIIKSLVIRITLTAAAISLVATAAMLVFAKYHLMASFAFGFAISALSFSVLATSVFFVFSQDRKKGLLWGGVGIAKLFALGMLMWYLVTRNMIEPISFLGGFSTVVFSLFIESFRLNLSTKKVS